MPSPCTFSFVAGTILGGLCATKLQNKVSLMMVTGHSTKIIGHKGVNGQITSCRDPRVAVSVTLSVTYWHQTRGASQMKGQVTKKLGAVALATAIGFAAIATWAADPITERRD